MITTTNLASICDLAKRKKNTTYSEPCIYSSSTNKNSKQCHSSISQVCGTREWNNQILQTRRNTKIAHIISLDNYEFQILAIQLCFKLRDIVIKFTTFHYRSNICTYTQTHKEATKIKTQNSPSCICASSHMPFQLRLLIVSEVTKRNFIIIYFSFS